MREDDGEEKVGGRRCVKRRLESKSAGKNEEGEMKRGNMKVWTNARE